MPSALLSVTELKLALGEETGTDNDELYTQLIDQVQAIFEAECNRHERPFAGVQAARTEIHDGTGSAELFLEYPAAAITSIVIGRDFSDPTETLDPADGDEIVWAVGSRQVSRVDGGTFSTAGTRRIVRVIYNASADLPRAAKSAVLAGCKVLVSRLGSEGVASERIGGYQIDYASFVTADMGNDPIWKLGVSACWEPRI